MITDSSIPVRSFDDLLAPMHEAIKPASAFRIGTEAEKQGVVLETGKPVGFTGTILPILEALVSRGWEPEREHEDRPLISLRRNGASITLEPGGQLELSGAPLETLHETADELDDHLSEIRPLSDARGIAWLGLGFHPFASRNDYEWVPKLRYPIMRRYLPTRGALALDMMLRTATVQANYDFSSEEDAIRKLRVGLALSPIGTAMFANSPFVEGKVTGELSRRARKILHAVVAEYLQRGDAVGSRTITRRHEIGLSPATVKRRWEASRAWLQHRLSASP